MKIYYKILGKGSRHVLMIHVPRPPVFKASQSTALECVYLLRCGPNCRLILTEFGWYVANQSFFKSRFHLAVDMFVDFTPFMVEIVRTMECVSTSVPLWRFMGKYSIWCKRIYRWQNIRSLFIQMGPGSSLVLCVWLILTFIRANIQFVFMSYVFSWWGFQWLKKVKKNRKKHCYAIR